MSESFCEQILQYHEYSLFILNLMYYKIMPDASTIEDELSQCFKLVM